jgi:CRP-like cAMP-binding protein
VRTATLVARGPCRALALDYQRFQRFLLAFPESALALLKLTVKQLLDRNAFLQTMSH